MASARRGTQLLVAASRGALFGRNNNALFCRGSHHNIIIERSTTSISSTSSCTNESITSSCDTTKQFIPLIQDYDQQVSDGKLLHDELQKHAAKKMTRLQMTLNEYDHDTFLGQLELLEHYESDNRKKQQERRHDEQKRSPTLEQEQKDEQDEASPPPPSISIPIPRGFYIHGNVGTGKSLLLNNFYNGTPTFNNITSTTENHKKRRLHFHSFLQEIHQRIHKLNKQILQQHGRSFHVNTSKQRNAIIQIAEQLSQEVTLLCIDEFQVTDIADAMILSQFFGELWRRGVVIVATSNRPPRDLYEGGLNREYFMPFIDLLERYCVVHHLGNNSDDGGSANNKEKDYRRIRSGVNGEVGSDKQCGEYFYLTRGDDDQQLSVKYLDELFQSFQEPHSQTIGSAQPLVLQANFQRTISISKYHSNKIARFTFDELCTTELGSSDYQAIAKHFQIVIVEDIPQLTLKYPDRARRFITLVDELYEAGCCLACSAVDIPDRLFVGKSCDSENKQTESLSIVDKDKDISGNMHAIDVAQVQGSAVSELASVRELSFAFGRAASRLLEMCSETWWQEKGAALQGVFSE